MSQNKTRLHYIFYLTLINKMSEAVLSVDWQGVVVIAIEKAARNSHAKTRTKLAREGGSSTAVAFN